MGRSKGSPKITVPALILWWQQDPHISYEMAPISIDLCEDGHLITFEDATHWVLHDEPEATSKYRGQHFSKEPISPTR